uniref:Uncharacterized protein n=1 Tax=Hemiselmis tepida TaxID=464990 RepID=A0A7S0VV21_9CRYP|mmetsp:Transcript_29320/g.74312  ORF Transcript_29320/g.74312 Transcript_29320/m.74312 type:complete len:292 (+) Transcript_29320:1-876(+)
MGTKRAISMQIVSPLVTPKDRVRPFRATVAVAASLALLALACVAVGSLDGSSEESAAGEPRELSLKKALGAVAKELKKVKEGIKKGPGGEVKASKAAQLTRGSVPTDAVEASIIMGDSPNIEKNMGKQFPDEKGGLEERGHTDPAPVADAIIDFANDENEDVTGKRGEEYYNSVVLNSKHPERLKGSLPTYRAESKFITSGIVGNYEKAMENDPVVTVAIDPHANPRVVAAGIVDGAVANALDCTGGVGPDGLHANGQPPCEKSEPFDNKLHDIETKKMSQTPEDVEGGER